MKALVLNSHGTLDDVSIGDLPVPHISSQEVLVELRAAALNRLDLWVVEGWKGLKLQFPHILGNDGSGVIAQVGSDVRDFALGDRVAINPTLSCGSCDYCRTGRDHMCDSFAIFGEHVPGFYTQYQKVPERNLLKLPDHVSFEVSAASSLVYVTAWHSLIKVGRFQAGETILVIGAGGGANTAYIDIARLAGAGRIIVVGSSEKKLQVARELGADYVINRLEEDWSKAVYTITGRQGVDVVVDNVGAATFVSSLRSLRKGGRLLTVGNTSGPNFEFENRYMFSKHLSILGSTMGPVQSYGEVMELVFAGKLHPAIDSVVPLDEGLEALQRLERGEVSGKIVLSL